MDIDYTFPTLRCPKNGVLMHIENVTKCSIVMLTFTLMEYRTNGPKVVTLRWRMVRRRVWKPETNFDICLGFFFERIRRFAWVSIKVTSMSAIEALLIKVYFLPTWEKVCSESEKNSANGVNNELLFLVVGIPPGSELIVADCFRKFSFWTSSECTRCSSSFTNSMAPPTMEAWSPCRNNGANWWKYLCYLICATRMGILPPFL